MRLVCLIASLFGYAAAQTEQQAFFESKVNPLFAHKCLACHGAAAVAGLRLDSRDAVLKGGKSGPAIVPGSPEQSLLIQAVARRHATLRMPPTGDLDAQQVSDLEKWVLDGAVWAESSKPAASMTAVYEVRPEQKDFWSFQPVRKPELPVVNDLVWSRNPIDRWIFAKLNEKGLKPGKKADRAALIRRLTFDLTDCRPLQTRTTAFEQDRSPDAFEKVIDRLLDTPQYGERWGRHWLDLVRYADTAGDAADFPVPEMYNVRNYVIDSFQRDKPYNQFLKEQIAGDLLPYEDEEQRWEQIVGTGYIAVSRRVGVSPTSDRHMTIEDTIITSARVC